MYQYIKSYHTHDRSGDFGCIAQRLEYLKNLSGMAIDELVILSPGTRRYTDVLADYHLINKEIALIEDRRVCYSGGVLDY